MEEQAGEICLYQTFRVSVVDKKKVKKKVLTMKPSEWARACRDRWPTPGHDDQPNDRSKDVLIFFTPTRRATAIRVFSDLRTSPSESEASIVCYSNRCLSSTVAAAAWLCSDSSIKAVMRSTPSSPMSEVRPRSSSSLSSASTSCPKPL
jgi:hypothetical protein